MVQWRPRRWPGWYEHDEDWAQLITNYFQFDLNGHHVLICAVWIIYKESGNELSVMMPTCFLFRITMHLEITYRQLLFVTRWTCECWIFMKSECLNCFTQGVHTPKNSCFDSWSTNFPDRYCGFCSTSLRTILNSRSCVWSFIGLGGVNTRMFDLLAKCNCVCTRWAWNASVYF